MYKLAKTAAIVAGLAIALSACQKSDDDNSKSIKIETPEIVEKALLPALAAEEEAGFGKNAGQLYSNDARHDFENFYMAPEGVAVQRNVKRNANDELSVDKLDMDFNKYIGLYKLDPPVSAGSKYEGTITMWSDSSEPVEMVIQLNSFCTADNPEGSTKNVTLTNEPQKFDITHTFENGHGCAVLRVTNVTRGGASIYGQAANLTIMK